MGFPRVGFVPEVGRSPKFTFHSVRHGRHQGIIYRNELLKLRKYTAHIFRNGQPQRTSQNDRRNYWGNHFDDFNYWGFAAGQTQCIRSATTDENTTFHSVFLGAGFCAADYCCYWIFGDGQVIMRGYPPSTYPAIRRTKGLKSQLAPAP